MKSKSNPNPNPIQPLYLSPSEKKKEKKLTSSIRSSIRREIKIRALQLPRLPLPPHRDLVLPDALRALRQEIGDLRRHVPWGDGVGARKTYPFYG